MRLCAQVRGWPAQRSHHLKRGQLVEHWHQRMSYCAPTHPRTHAPTHPRPHARPPARTHARPPARPHALARTHAYAHAHASTRARTRTRTRTRTHTHAHAHAHAHAHILSEKGCPQTKTPPMSTGLQGFGVHFGTRGGPGGCGSDHRARGHPHGQNRSPGRDAGELHRCAAALRAAVHQATGRKSVGRVCLGRGGVGRGGVRIFWKPVGWFAGWTFFQSLPLGSM